MLRMNWIFRHIQKFLKKNLVFEFLAKTIRKNGSKTTKKSFFKLKKLIY
jgi:hypothetical protein